MSLDSVFKAQKSSCKGGLSTGTMEGQDATGVVWWSSGAHRVLAPPKLHAYTVGNLEYIPYGEGPAAPQTGWLRATKVYYKNLEPEFRNQWATRLILTLKMHPPAAGSCQCSLSYGHIYLDIK